MLAYDPDSEVNIACELKQSAEGRVSRPRDEPQPPRLRSNPSLPFLLRGCPPTLAVCCLYAVHGVYGRGSVDQMQEIIKAHISLHCQPLIIDYDH